MPRFAANISFLFTEHEFLYRFAAAAGAGFEAVELHFPYAHSVDTVKARLDHADLKLVLLNTPPGDVDAGEFGLAAVPGRTDDFARQIDQAVNYAAALGAGVIHVLSGMLRSEADRLLARRTLIKNLQAHAPKAAEKGITLVLEPLNGRDKPGYFLSTIDDAVSIAQEVAQPNVKVLFDAYHVQITQGDLFMRLAKYLPLIGHVQIAAVPTRHEPDTGEIHYEHFYAELDRLGYTGWVGAEYKPANGTVNGLDWARRCGAIKQRDA